MKLASAIKIQLLSLALTPALSFGASFDCHKAEIPVEKLVCGSNDLRFLDVQLFEAYQRAQRISADANLVRTEQRRWIQESRNTCKTNDCLSKSYEARINVLVSNIHYKECESDNNGVITTLGESYCAGRNKVESEKTINDLTTLLSKRYNSHQLTQFTKLQNEWRKNIDCSCEEKIGSRIEGPGLTARFIECQIEAMNERLSEIREIVVGQQDIEYGGTSIRSCADVQQAEEANPEHQMLEAIKKNDIANVKRLIDKGVSIPSGEYRYTPLDIAVRNGNVEMLSYLLSKGASPVRDIEAMKLALSKCNMRMVSLLVEHGYQVKSDRNYTSYDPLPWAALHGCTDIIKYLVSRGADIKFSKPLRHAVMMCHVDTVKYLLSNGHDPDTSDMNYTPLWYATINAVNSPDKREMCKTVINDLLQAGANPERALEVQTNNPALKHARDDDEIMKLLRSKSGRP